MERTAQSDQVVSGLLEAAPDAIIAVDQDGRIVVVNAQAERLFGYGRDELLGQEVEMLVPEEARSMHPRHRDVYLSDPRPRPMGAGMELVGRRRDGTTFPAEISLSPVTSDERVLVAAAIRDVTDRKRAEAKFRGLLEAAPDAMVCVDRAGEISIVNAQAERLFGYGREELIGQPVEILVPEIVRDRHRVHRVGYFDDPRPRPMGANMRLAARRKDGSEFQAEISLGPLETEDGLLVSAAIRDITERLEIEAERERLLMRAEREEFEARLQQSQRLESLGQLAGGVAHDFNNLLAVILNYASFVHEEVSAAADQYDAARWKTVAGDVSQIELAAERAARLTHQLLAFARREVVSAQVVNLNSVVEDLEQLLRRTIGEHVELVTNLGPDLWPILADRGQMEQVLVNLAVNARDAMAEGGTLTIETDNVVVDENYATERPELRAGRYVRVQVSDIGTGMDQDVKARAFEPFYTTKPKGAGSGLGLATVYGILNQAGGSVQIYSELGIGTTVTGLLPATELDRPPAPTPSRGSGASGGETVLIVEDEDGMREVTRRILTRRGYKVLTACDGAEALDIVADSAERIDLLLTDVVMPKMLGREVADRVCALVPGIRVLYMSGYAQPVLGAKGTLEPGVTLVQKPFMEAVLLGKIREVLDADK